MPVPHLEQERDYSCLAACVRMVLAFYGAEHPESELRGLLKTRPGGTSPANVLLRLPTLGFEAAVYTGSAQPLREGLLAGRPGIVHVWTPPLPHWDVEAIHAVVVVGWAEDALSIHDPVLPTGPTQIPLNAFLRAWAATDYLTILISPSS
jgi:ABC-type bacteriocin/lantibiotic exporter with double-glycine peptidase domain